MIEIKSEWKIVDGKPMMAIFMARDGEWFNVSIDASNTEDGDNLYCWLDSSIRHLINRLYPEIHTHRYRLQKKLTSLEKEVEYYKDSIEKLLSSDKEDQKLYCGLDRQIETLKEEIENCIEEPE